MGLIASCDVCNKTQNIPLLTELLNLKGEAPYPFIIYYPCCTKRLKVILEENNGLTFFYEDV